MAIELITCNGCGTKNASHRTVCLACGNGLARPAETVEIKGQELPMPSSEESLKLPKDKFHFKQLDRLHWSLLGIIFVLGTLNISFWLSPYQYQKMRDRIVRIHRISGKADVLRLGSWSPYSYKPKPPKPSKQYMD